MILEKTADFILQIYFMSNNDYRRKTEKEQVYKISKNVVFSNEKKHLKEKIIIFPLATQTERT
jgi:hypothetical protein